MSTITCRWLKIDPHAYPYFQGVELGPLSIQPYVLQLVRNIVRGVRFTALIPFISYFVIHTTLGHNLTILIQKLKKHPLPYFAIRGLQCGAVAPII
jgi:hypothetical protein